MRTLLILGGTGEARALAARAGGWRVVTSLAGRVRDPRLPEGEVRIGGFGGPDGLAAWLVAQDVGAVVDATHPFASRISASAVAAARATGVPLLALHRPGWTEEPGDDWRRVPSVEAAAAALATLGTRVMLTTGRQSLAAFADLDLFFLVRTVDPPQAPLPRRHHLLLDRGPYTVEGEAGLMRKHAIDVLVTKDSGGTMTAAKLVAARDRGIPVVLVDRPAKPGVQSVSTVDEAVEWLRDTGAA
ncbi:cobalt-precorrin-6A reductase [Phytohabitans sp. ZYX-F-186]|uniref:Cobalt-precorrin-6A reductase n=1 Tax=Phytohabitans maris TaxID=3071409 RepID=A0ABU0ZUU0_9ACTN|nr:cobalt-precorrin-6A reductase [Phytohabitans sp. ZYX-F-186]MDQ7909697.1 cobalt-precorrin-6A reductase [Phytohabitans sp. ZYX-F-186]